MKQSPVETFENKSTAGIFPEINAKNAWEKGIFEEDSLGIFERTGKFSPGLLQLLHENVLEKCHRLKLWKTSEESPVKCLKSSWKKISLDCKKGWYFFMESLEQHLKEFQQKKNSRNFLKNS